MITEIFGYAIVIAALVGLAAVAVEHLLAELRRPRRFAWLGAFVVALAFPPLAWWLAPAAPAPLTIVAGERPPQAFAAYAAIDWNAIFIPLWVVATAVLLTFYGAAWLRLGLLARRWPQASGEPSSVVVAADVGPAVLGILKPCIVLPRWLMDAPAAVRSTVLAHELEHIAARDPMLIVAAQLVAIALPWNLPLWWFVRRLRAAIELDCDARVLRRGIDAAHYADVLLAVGQHRPASLYVAATLIEPVTQLERRIRIMLTTRGPASIGRTLAAVGVAGALAACATQVDPPEIVVSSPPTALDGGIVSFESTGPGGISITKGADGQTTVLAGEVLVRVGGPGEMQITSELIVRTAESTIFEGNVRIDADRTSITAQRARATTNSQGEMVLTVEDAKVIRTFAEPSTLAE